MDQIILPEHATDASRRRAERALELARSCPPELAEEIALVGSSARGLADDGSDIEMNHWAAVMPPVEARVDWLRAAGATGIEAEDAPRSDQSHWLTFWLDGMPGEAGWQTFDALRDNVTFLRSGATIDRKVLFLADILVSARPLRTTGHLARVQAQLNDYSDTLQRAIIAAAVERWSPPAHLVGLRRLARHGETLALTERLLADVDMAARVLYAVHRRWEPSAKWTLTVAREFAPDLPLRVDAMLGDPLPERRVELCGRLCLDALALAPQSIDFSAAVAAWERGLSG